jgi:cyanophycinase
MMDELMRLSGLNKKGHMIIIPTASAEPDSADYYARKQFGSIGGESIKTLLPTRKGLSEEEFRLVSGAGLIYLTGGSQARFMDSIRNTNTETAIREAFNNGAVIAGTSAGAAVQSKWMITGDQKKYPVYTGRFETIEADNIELKEGLGLLPSVIIDQHFIKRQRLNRLLSVIIENPSFTGIGIDESTAIHVQGDRATVYGTSQVIVVRCREEDTGSKHGLLGVKDMSFSIYLPGESFKIPE